MNHGSPAAKKSTWPKQTAIVVSDSPNVHMLLRELMRSYGWTVVDSTPDVAHAATMVKQGLAYLIIVDDLAQHSAVRHLRYLLSDPVTLCTPILSFLLESHKIEVPSLQRMGRPSLVDKPLTPSKFVPGFVNLVRVWEKEPFLSLRRANRQFILGNDGIGIRALAKIADVAGISQFCAQALALHLRKLGKIKEAESLLLGALKRDPRELGTVLALADLYLHTGMPKLAHRLLIGARGSYPQSMAMMPDLVQAAILMNNLPEAINYLSAIVRSGDPDAESLAFLTRLLFAEGREVEAERLFAGNRTAFKKIQAAWVLAEGTTPAPGAAAS